MEHRSPTRTTAHSSVVCMQGTLRTVDTGPRHSHGVGCSGLLFCASGRGRRLGTVPASRNAYRVRLRWVWSYEPVAMLTQIERWSSMNVRSAYLDNFSNLHESDKYSANSCPR